MASDASISDISVADKAYQESVYEGVAIPSEPADTVVFVTGANGFVATYCVELLLSLGYQVRGSLRSETFQKGESARRHLTCLKGAGDRLSLVEANLDDEESYINAIKGSHIVLHTASPYVLDVEDPQKELVDPAVRGTTNVLRACIRNKVARVVLTSSMAAITDAPKTGKVYTVDDWNTESSLTRNPYYFSKTEAEKAAWSLARYTNLPMATVNPVVVIGPENTPAINSSNKILHGMMTGEFPGILDLSWNMVDVRDVAALHVAAMKEPAAMGKRFIACSDSIIMKDCVDFLRSSGYEDYKLPTVNLANSVGRKLSFLASFAQAKATGTYLRTNIGKHGTFDNTASVELLGRPFKPIRESIIETVNDLIAKGAIEPVSLSGASTSAAPVPATERVNSSASMISITTAPSASSPRAPGRSSLQIP